MDVHLKTHNYTHPPCSLDKPMDLPTRKNAPPPASAPTPAAPLARGRSVPSPTVGVRMPVPTEGWVNGSSAGSLPWRFGVALGQLFRGTRNSGKKNGGFQHRTTQCSVQPKKSTEMGG